MKPWEGWAVVDENGKLMQTILENGPSLFSRQIHAMGFARTCDEESLRSDNHRAVRVTVTVSVAPEAK